MNPQNSLLISPQPLGRRPAAATLNRRPSVMVISHERSGTHFLMNALARAYDYAPGQRVDFDQSALNINYFEPQAVSGALGRLTALRPDAIIKSHHAVEFFDSVLDEVLKKTLIFYIHRDPAAVMISFWRFVKNWSWHEGPKRATAVEFAAAPPEGQLMRYQMNQRRTMLDRWAAHVEGWVNAARDRERIVVVRFDELKDRYEQTVAGFQAVLGPRSGSLVPPSRHTNVIAGKAADLLGQPDVEALRALALSEIGDAMRRLGYA